MCGIVGIFNFGMKEKINPGLLIEMRDEMFHRGPDECGIWISKDGFTGLAHRRLSIIDLSKAASQPMSNEDSSVWIIYNGEIYNHLKIRKELIGKGHLFKTDHSDTEVVIHSFEEWGINCINKFRGMFAFCIWDDKKKELWLVRDRIGIKPIYFTVNNGRFIFASEIKSILVDKIIPREVNKVSFYNYLSFLTSPAPETMFKGINKIPSGSYLHMRKNGDFKIYKYWDVLDFIKPVEEKSEEEIISKLLEDLETSVQYRKLSDVPTGVFLSGGIDSSVNAVLFSKNSREVVNTFTIGYEGENPSYLNEFIYAKKISDLIGANYHEKILNIHDFIGFLKDLVFYQDEPIGDPVCFPIYFVSKLAKDNGVTVCQLGEGSDELFMGYPNWQLALKMYKLNSIPLTGFFKKVTLLLLAKTGSKNRYAYEWLRRAVNNEPIFWGGAEAFFEDEKKSLLSVKFQKYFKDFSSLEAIKPVLNSFTEKTDCKSLEQSPLQWMTYLDLNFRLPELLLMRVDKMSMANSLEARVPFLDHEFVEYVMSIPQNVKIGSGVLKYLFKKAVKNILPSEIINRKKQGFGVPIYEWFFKEFGGFARDKLNSFNSHTDFFDKKYIDVLFRNNSAQKIWFVLNFVLWHERWIENIKSHEYMETGK